MQEKALVMVKKLPSKMKMQFNGSEVQTTALLEFVVSRLHNQKVVNKVHESSNACKVKGK